MTGGVVRRDGLREAVDRVKVLHKRAYAGRGPDDGGLRGAYCDHCSNLMHDYVSWPCATRQVLDAVPDVPPTEAPVHFIPHDAGYLCGAPSGIGSALTDVVTCRACLSRMVPVVPPDPPAVDRAALIQVIGECMMHDELADDPDYIADHLLSSGVLVAAADVRASALEDALERTEDVLEQIEAEAKRREGSNFYGDENWLGWAGAADLIRDEIARLRTDRAVSEREGDGS